MSPFVDTLKAEIDALRLDLSLRPDPRAAKLDALQETLRLYEGGAPGAVGISGHVKKRRVVGERTGASIARNLTMARAEDYLRALKSDEPVRTAQIFDAISGLVDIRGRDPRSNLSAMMSQCDKFLSHGRKGWTLAQPQALQMATPQPDWASAFDIFDAQSSEGKPV